MMFGSKADTKIETILGNDTELDGNVHTTAAIRIDGKIKGEVSAESIIIGEHGIILGDVSCNKVIVGGKVKGNISASTSLELLPKSQLLGDIRTAKLIIADGALFEGNCQMMKSDGQVIEMNPDNVGENGPRPQKGLKVAGGVKH